MAAPINKTKSADALVGLWTLAITAFVVSALFFAREILIPLSLAALLTFLLSPLVSRLGRWVGRIAAVLVVVLLIFGLLGAGGWVLTRQLVDLATKLPDYKQNIQSKLRSFKAPQGGTFQKFSETVEELKQDLPGNEPTTITETKGKPQTAVTSSPRATPPPVQVVQTTKANPLDLIRVIVAPVVGPLGTAALVLLLVIFMLLQKEDLRSRLIRLIGQGRISTTTRAMDDAADRVSRYLLMQLIVNVSYGVPVAIGLYFIGVPNAVLWGAFAIVLRFIPYVGPWIAAAFPIILSLAVSPGWMMPLLTIGLFIVLELLSNNVMEPWLYGSSTGVSSMALIVGAVFWTWLWGPVGLVLATPLTVCLVVMGRHVPRLSFLSILLSDEEALTPAEDCYHRLLTVGEQDEMELVESYLKANSLTALYDSMLVPVLTTAETDHRRDLLDQEQRTLVLQSVRDIVEDLGTRPPVPSKIKADRAIAAVVAPPAPAPASRVYCLPSRAERDELAGAMLAQLLKQQGFEAQNASAKLVVGELIALVEEAQVDAVCLSVVAPSTVIHARYLCLKIRAALPEIKIAVGLWGTTEGVSEAARRLRDSGADEVVTSLADAVVQLAKLSPVLDEPMQIAPVPADEEARLAALAELDLMSENRPALDRLTARLTRIFEVPIALVTLIDRDRQFFKAQQGLPAELAQAGETARDVSVCSHVVADNKPLVVEDLARDRRFANNPLLKDRGLRFYAGIPLRAANGQPIGSLCLLDVKPRRFTEREQRLLQEFAAEAMEAIGATAQRPSAEPALTSP
ncbi:MAG: AI-2E family transporter [Chthoniobacterales bacterium]